MWSRQFCGARTVSAQAARAVVRDSSINAVSTLVSKPAFRGPFETTSSIAVLLALLSVAALGQTPSPAQPMLTASEVMSVVQSAATSVNSTTMVIAVTDRMGNILAIFREPNAPTQAAANFGVMTDSNDVAVALARTAAFFSNSQAPLSSRTVRFISGTHFPFGVMYTGNGPLYGIENTNRGCPLNANFASTPSARPRLPGEGRPIFRDANAASTPLVPPATLIDGAKPGLGPITGKVDLYDSDQNAVNPGGVPLFKGGVLVGGVGVTGVAANIAEFAAYSGSVGAKLGAAPAPPGVVFINGIALPFVNQTMQPAGTAAGPFNGNFAPGTNGVIGPIPSPGPAPEGELVAAQASSTMGGLSQAEVQNIVDAAVAAANQTRAVIRLPLGSTTRMAIAVADLNGNILALNRMPDATVFSIDVAVAKARNVIYFSSSLPPLPAGTAVTNRTIGFGAQPFYPPGIDNTSPGPFFGLYQYDQAHACSQGTQPPSLPSYQSGIVFFPGSLPLYRNGVLVGGLGVSGDGVDQDDYVTAQGAINFPAPTSIRADQIVFDGVRLPYQTFPRNPTTP
jgi:uncharacterized protein GlcG (DUF336 family)